MNGRRRRTWIKKLHEIIIKFIQMLLQGPLMPVTTFVDLAPKLFMLCSAICGSHFTNDNVQEK